jgi:predicted patatin/cPLA2 family phospholipase
MNTCFQTGLVIEGGGFRAIYAAAVLEAMHTNQLHFPYAVGVSAGAAYGVSYVSRQAGRNLETNALINHPLYCGLKHFLKNGNYFNWEFIYKTIPTQIIPLDYQALAQSTTHFQVVVTNCLTAHAEYLDANTSSPDQLRDLLTATSSLPFVAKMKPIDQVPYLDGGLTDPIPVKHALSQGNKRLVVILTRPKGYLKKPSKAGFATRLIYHKYPGLLEKMNSRIDRYNKTLIDIEEMEASGIAFVIRPTQPIPIGRMQNNPQTLEKVYHSALKTMEPLMSELKNWLKAGITNHI